MQHQNEIIELIDKTIKHILNSTNFIFCRWGCANEAQNELQFLRQRIQNQDELAIQELDYLFAPTCSLQELSIDNGWGEDFIAIACKLEKLI